VSTSQELLAQHAAALEEAAAGAATQDAALRAEHAAASAATEVLITPELTYQERVDLAGGTRLRPLRRRCAPPPTLSSSSLLLSSLELSDTQVYHPPADNTTLPAGAGGAAVARGRST